MAINKDQPLKIRGTHTKFFYLIMETTFKIITTILLVIIPTYSIIWLWTHQIDVRATLKNKIREPLSAITQEIVTRDSNSIYQNGNVVGKIFGDVTLDSQNNYIVFKTLYDTAKINLQAPIEYQRFICRIIKTGVRAGIQATIKNGVPMQLGSTINDVTCKKE